MSKVNSGKDRQSLGISAYVRRTEGGNLYFKKTWQLGNTIGFIYGLATAGGDANRLS